MNEVDLATARGAPTEARFELAGMFDDGTPPAVWPRRFGTFDAAVAVAHDLMHEHHRHGLRWVQIAEVVATITPEMVEGLLPPHEHGE